MLRTATILLCLTCALPAAAQRDSTARTIAIESVDISGRRPMKEIGVQRTQLDSTVLHENIALSMADVLTQNANLFIKSYGRATLATAEFRGTSPSHTQVTWNGMRINSPMLGQVDFSLIPAYFIDDATIYHGASSVGVTGGGLGGAVTLATKAPAEQGLGLRYVQGIGSFATFDEFLHLTYGGARWSSSTRVLYSTSDNDFRFRNYNSKEFVTDDNGQIVGEYYPLQRNRNGGFRRSFITPRAAATVSRWRHGTSTLTADWRCSRPTATKANRRRIPRTNARCGPWQAGSGCATD